jgi:Na+-translocating ferredoxin:NAD+ oxidoreductase RnfG subunit
MKDSIKLGVTLFVITAVAAGVLAFSNDMTAPIIAE